MVKATTEDVLVFSAKPILEKNGPAMKHSLRVVKPGQARKYLKHFSLPAEYGGGSPPFSKGWLYAFVGGTEANGFCALAFDGTNSFLFNELRYKGKSIAVGEGPCNAQYDPLKGGVRVNEPRRRVSWRGKCPEYEVDVAVSDGGENELLLHYSFQRIKPNTGGYKCVFEKFGRVFAHWVLAPMHGRLTIDAKGDLKALGCKELEPLTGKTIESDFGYAENVHVNAPLVNVGWQWSVLACQNSPGELKPEKIVGFMDLFLGGPRLPLNYQVYVLDVETGGFQVYADAETIFDAGEIPVVRVKNKEGTVKLVIQGSSLGKRRRIKGKKLADFLHTADIDYRSYPSVGTAVINNKEYQAVGTSEFAGATPGYWI